MNNLDFNVIANHTSSLNLFYYTGCIKWNSTGVTSWDLAAQRKGLALLMNVVLTTYPKTHLIGSHNDLVLHMGDKYYEWLVIWMMFSTYICRIYLK